MVNRKTKIALGIVVPLIIAGIIILILWLLGAIFKKEDGTPTAITTFATVSLGPPTTLIIPTANVTPATVTPITLLPRTPLQIFIDAVHSAVVCPGGVTSLSWDPLDPLKGTFTTEIAPVVSQCYTSSTSDSFRSTFRNVTDITYFELSYDSVSSLDGATLFTTGFFVTDQPTINIGSDYALIFQVLAESGFTFVGESGDANSMPLSLGAPIPVEVYGLWIDFQNQQLHATIDGNTILSTPPGNITLPSNMENNTVIFFQGVASDNVGGTLEAALNMGQLTGLPNGNFFHDPLLIGNVVGNANVFTFFGEEIS